MIGGLSDDSKKALQNQAQSLNNVPLIWNDGKENLKIEKL